MSKHRMWIAASALLVACGSTETQPDRGATAQAGETVGPAGSATTAPAAGEPERPPDEPEAPPAEQTCDTRIAAIEERITALASQHRACRYDVECVLAGIDTSCYRPCDEFIHPRGVGPLRALSAEIESDTCPEWRAAACSSLARCALVLTACVEGLCSRSGAGGPSADDVPAPIPAHNSPDQTDAPPRPENGAADEKARRLFEAIVHDDWTRAADFFLPREAFLRVKAIADPGGYWDRLFARYQADIHALHERTPDLERARFDRLEIVRRGGWTRVREEGNAVPYWVSRHSWLHYTVDGRPRKLEVRVLITWDGEWWITHLSEFH